MNICTQRFLFYYYQHYLFPKICLLILLCFHFFKYTLEALIIVTSSYKPLFVMSTGL